MSRATERQCPLCERPFTGRGRSRFCPACREVVRKREHRLLEKREKAALSALIVEANACAFPASDATIATARKKPRGVSDVRWRIELRRRANPEYYNACISPEARR